MLHQGLLSELPFWSKVRNFKRFLLHSVQILYAQGVFLNVNSMQSLLELQKSSNEGNKLKAKVREIARGSFSILGRQEPPKVVMLHGDGNESWRQ